MDEDISKNTILVFLVLTIVISLLSTWTLIQSIDDMPDEPENTGSAKVSIRIQQPTGNAIGGSDHAQVDRAPEH